MPCTVFKPIVDSVVDLFQDSVELIPLSKTSDSSIFVQHGVRTTPTVAYRDKILVGACTQSELIDFINQTNTELD